ncbi:MAG: DUF3320 domain-containing protein [Lentisphaerae bacterium]|nr:DUF3320 domain-containing protein [Lentisphaerota bacterium]
MENSIGSPQADRLTAALDFVPRLNLAVQQNAVTFIRSITLNNQSGSDLAALECVLTAEPEFIREKVLNIEQLKSGEEMIINDPEPVLNYDLLAGLDDCIRGKLFLQVRTPEGKIFESAYDCDVFAPDQWLGSQTMPELIAAFVTPNMEIVARLQSEVAAELERATGDSSIQGYQADKTRVYEICAAIYRAVRNWGIQYSNPASSFGQPGQRIRFADVIYQHKLGTCLDTAMLFASVMEACGLHPVVIFNEGHAYIGCHLLDHYFPNIPLDDLQSIRKLADMDEFLVIETTMVTGNASFAEAESYARINHLADSCKFDFAVDIVRARLSKILPLPIRNSVNGMEFLPVERHVKPGNDTASRQLEAGVDLDELDPGTAASRLDRWTKKLLDLSLRNRLLNVRDTKLTIPLVCHDIAELENSLADKETLSLASMDEFLTEKELHDMTTPRNSEVDPENKLLLENEFARRRLRTFLPQNELNRRLTALYRQGKSDLEEGGVNTIYLAIGFLEWKAAEKDSGSNLAPILLIPVNLQRKTIAEGIRISRQDGETIINETLLEMLSSQYDMNIPGVSPLPADESGTNVGKVMQIFRSAIRDKRGWEVRDEVRLGHFSFGKFVMWSDMTRQIGVLKRNPLIGHLISGGGIFDDGIEVFPVSEVASHLDPAALFCPLSADSSQLAAVLYSAMGKNFVLNGPPGTGKSQTIANIIAHNLALGRRVLFVSEKKAALDVVHRRLTEIGLNPFCLELHSNKAGKAAVLAQFNEALQTADSCPPAGWQETVANLEKLRAELDTYVVELHRTFACGHSAYDCFAYLLGQTGNTPLPDIVDVPDLINTPREKCHAIREKFLEFVQAYKLLPANIHPSFNKLESLQWSPVLQKQLMSAANTLLDAVNNASAAFAAAAAPVALHDLTARDTIDKTVELLTFLQNCPDMPAEFFRDDFSGKLQQLADFAAVGKALADLQQKLHSYRLELFKDFDFAGTAKRFRENEGAAAPVRLVKNFMLFREISPLKKLGSGRFTAAELKNLLPNAARYLALSKKFEDGKTSAIPLLQNLWKDLETDWNAVITRNSYAMHIHESVAKIAGNNAALHTAVLEKLRMIMPDLHRSIDQNSLDKLRTALEQLQEKSAAFAGYSAAIANQNDLADSANDLRCITGNIDSLRDILRYRRIRSGLIDDGGLYLVDLTENNPDTANCDFEELFDALFFKHLLDQILEISPGLCRFNGTVHNGKIQKFCELDEKYMAMTGKMIFATLAANLPRRRNGQCPDGSALGILKHECEKKSRHKPVRLLLEQISTLVHKLKPCFLMSPLSVAQYLPPDSEPFDLVVFDEASQIPVWDAIGVIARGKQLIVVGDPKQMPPTNFFQKINSAGEDNGDTGEVDDLESILDECLAAGIHSTSLNWHYRSRHESLIAFSNHHYYGDRLNTFPAAKNSGSLGIRFEFVPDGVYDYSASRTNRKEAEALVAYIFDHLKYSGGKFRSAGVVAFSQPQKELIEDLIEKERRRHPGLEAFFSDAVPEPFFVKNLENVQGDERDVILFSIGYAPDASGRFSMNFGPINRQGGERRLNVAVTRAKEQIVVFSSIHAGQIDLNRTSAVGAAHLKYFLDYAERGYTINTAGNKNNVQNFSAAVAKYLTNKGYPVEFNVGCSGFRIDLAVRNPDNPETFLAAIECDNSAYAAQYTTRDRDNLRRKVLEKLGWHVCRVWAVDWAFDRQRAQNELVIFLEQHRCSPPNDPKNSETPPEIPDNTPDLPTLAPSCAADSVNCTEYECWVSREYLFPAVFNTPEGQDICRRQVLEVIQQEAPIFENVLKKRIAKAWGFPRITTEILETIGQYIPDDLETSFCNEEKILWAPGQFPWTYQKFRISKEEKNKRSIDEIPPEELANAIRELIKDFDSYDKEILARETIRLFRLPALTAKARSHLNHALTSFRGEKK